jgi:hypothetical protein
MLRCDRRFCQRNSVNRFKNCALTVGRCAATVAQLPRLGGSARQPMPTNPAHYVGTMSGTGLEKVLATTPFLNHAINFA